jgi:nitrate reductase (NAD(P)H)
MKEAGQSITSPSFGPVHAATVQAKTEASQAPEVISMKNPEVKRLITLEELKAQPKEQPWFVVDGEGEYLSR